MRFFQIELTPVRNPWLPDELAHTTPDSTDCDLVHDDPLTTLNPLEELVPRRWRMLRDSWLNLQVRTGKISVEQLSDLPYQVSNTLCNAGVQRLIDGGFFSIDDVLRLKFANCQAITDPNVQQLIHKRQITFSDLSRINWAGCEAIVDAGVCALITTGVLPLTRLSVISRAASVAICYPGVQDLLREGLITMDHLMQITPLTGLALCNPERIQAYRNGQITLQRLLQGEPVVVPLNPQQSTHQKSVHITVTQSVLRLKQRYRVQLTGRAFQRTIRELREWGEGLPALEELYVTAQRGLQYVLEQVDFYRDVGSNISMREMLALVFCAIRDDTLRIVDREQAELQLVHGLYELQRGYNLSEFGVDDGGDDSPVCAGGAFHKILEKLQGVHPDVHLQFVNPATASYKLVVVVREVLTDHLQAMLQQVRVAPQALAFVHGVLTLQREGLAPIWHMLEPRISQQMLDEFEVLYSSPKEPAFRSMIESGQAAELKDWNIFQKPLQETRGYQDYVRKVIRHSHGLLAGSLKRRVFSTHEKIRFKQNIKVTHATTRKSEFQ